ncbi:MULTISPECIES: class I SAM-dependent methyltransferase [unclassified Frankia]|uniref:class I SAM-dependent methyltransferase n=1 Tax=unclassified Frankia TaxID=2632575 RepID=UPI001EE4B80B|nr:MULTISPECIES: class I SAM-dependent methyltransferase [unclassified Frankia]
MPETVPVAWSGAASAAPVEEAGAAAELKPQVAPEDPPVAALPYPGWGLQRSAKLLLAHRKEPVDPAGFYSLIAADSVRQLERYTSIADKLVLDVGGGPGYFRSAFMAAGARYYWVEPDVSEMGAAGIEVPGRIRGSALEMPIRTGSIDLTYTSNVLEHVPDPWKMCGELVRITKPGGLIFLSYTSWLSPWGGHETAPWHYLGGHRAAARFERLRGHPPKNVYGSSLFPVYVTDALAWAKTRMDVEIVDAMPRYLPDWGRAILRIPGLREIVTWNLAMILRKK